MTADDGSDPRRAPATDQPTDPPTGTPSDVPFDPPIAAASLSGEADAAWARDLAPVVGCAFLGGIALDPASREAARELVARDRSEFLPADPLAFVDEQLAALADANVRAGVNLRSATVGPIREAAAVCAEHGAIAEVNAHCRQPELCAVGCGESLLRDTPRLREYVAAAAETGATVSVKVRAEVPGVDLARTTRAIVGAGADVVHVDAMDSEHVVGEVVGAVEAVTGGSAGEGPGGEPCGGTGDASGDGTGDASGDGAGDAPSDWSGGEPGRRMRPFVVANNGVRDRASVREYLAYGADAVSVGRPTAADGDRAVMDRIAEAVAEWTDVAHAPGVPP